MSQLARPAGRPGPCLGLTLLLVAAQAGPARAQVVRSWQKISSTSGGLVGPLANNARFGVSAAGLGDLDGDGTPDMIVGANLDPDGGPFRGSVTVLFLNPSGTVRAEQKISSTQGGFSGPIHDFYLFGTSVDALGDLDGDGVTEVAVGAPLEDGGGSRRGAVWVLFLHSDGTVKANVKIGHGSGGFTGTLQDVDQFGAAVAGLGDLDGDGVEDLAVGAELDDDGGSDTGAVCVLFLKTDGTVKAHTKISPTSGGFGGALSDLDRFGSGLGLIGDLDGDGIVDLGVGAVRDDDGAISLFSDRGAAWLLFLNSNGTVRAWQKISDLAGGFPGVLDDLDHFGQALAGLGDFDHDGVLDLAVGAPGDDDGGTDRGAVWILLLRTDGTVHGHLEVNDLFGGFGGTLANADDFGQAIGLPGDVDGDGLADMLVGAPRADDGGTDRGAAWVLFDECYAVARVAFRNAGNPSGFVAVTSPVIGVDWECAVDILSQGAVASIVGVSLGGPATPGLGTAFGQLLCLPPFLPFDVAAGMHALPVPDDCRLVGQTVCTQAATVAPGIVRLQNALDATFGTL